MGTAAEEWNPLQKFLLEQLGRAKGREAASPSNALFGASTSSAALPDGESLTSLVDSESAPQGWKLIVNTKDEIRIWERK